MKYLWSVSRSPSAITLPNHTQFQFSNSRMDTSTSTSTSTSTNTNSFLAVDGFHTGYDFDFLLVDPDDKALSQWELINSSDADGDSDPSDYDYDRLDAVSPDGSVAAVLFVPLDEDSMDGDPAPSVVQYTNNDANPNPIAHAGVFGCDFGGSLWADHSDGGDDDEEMDDGLDDELVPRYLKGKLGRERIRKLGKRGCSKMNTSKKLPFLYMKPGCLHGKHGFGIGLNNSL